MAFLLTSVILNVGKVLLVFIFVFVFPDSSGVDASTRSILALALSSEFSLARITVLVLFRLCQRILGPTWWYISRRILRRPILFVVPGVFVILFDESLTLRALRIYLPGLQWSLEPGFGLKINGLINNLILRV